MTRSPEILAANAQTLITSARANGWAWVEQYTLCMFLKEEIRLACAQLGVSTPKNASRAALAEALRNAL